MMNMNPKQMVMQMMQKGMGGNNVALQNMIGLAQKGDTAGVENIARNLLQTKGINFDEAVRQFQGQYPQSFK